MPLEVQAQSGDVEDDEISNQHEGLTLEDEVFEEIYELNDVTFTRPVAIKNVKFRKGFCFQRCKFEAGFTLDNVQSQRGTASFSESTFHGVFRMRRSSRFYGADFSRCRFRRSAYFNSGHFQIGANFAGAKFSEKASFIRATFAGKADFSNCIFDGPAHFQKVDFKYSLSHAIFSDAKFSREALFHDAHFGGNARFNDAEFRSGANFEKTIFAESLEDLEGRSDDDEMPLGYNNAALFVDFSNASFLNGGSTPDSDAQTVLADFGSTTVGDRKTSRDLFFENVVLGQNRVDLTEPFEILFDSARIFGDSSFKGLKFGDDTKVHLVFKGVRFSGTVDVGSVAVNGDLTFEAAQFGGEVRLHKSKFEKFPDFRDAGYVRPPALDAVDFPKAGKITDKEDKNDALKRIGALRRIADQGNDRKTDSILHIAELKTEGGVASALFGLVADYGQSWLRPALWLTVLVFLIFPLCYLAVYQSALTSNVTQLLQDGGPPCKLGKGAAAIAAIELSISKSLFFAPSSDVRASRTLACLGGGSVIGAQSMISLVLEILQITATAMFLFLTGFGVRNRLRMN